MEEKILLVDDEESILNVLSYALNKEGYKTEKAYDGQEALDKFTFFKPNIVILDLMLPVISGYDVCKKIEDKDVGIIMLTAKNDIVDKLLGLELGADDYLTKPFDIREVIARVKSLSRRCKKASSASMNNDFIIIDDFKIDYRERVVTIGGREIEFTAKEFELLYLLLSNINLVYTRDQLLDLVWNMEYIGGTRTVDTHVQRVRKKLGSKYEKLIMTIHGVGYKGVNPYESGNKG